VRAALRTSWPGLSHVFGLHPWDTGRLSEHELAEYLEQLDEFTRIAAQRMT
jgi:hypothetical protein